VSVWSVHAQGKTEDNGVARAVNYKAASSGIVPRTTRDPPMHAETQCFCRLRYVPSKLVSK